MTAEALLPCPFCSAPPEYSEPAPSNWQCASVACSNPCCVVKPHSCVEKSPEEAIAAWNTRPTTPVTDEVVERDKLIEALTPSAETKTAYIGEFSFTVMDRDDDGEEIPRRVLVPWDTTKEIMAAIRNRALASMPTVVTGEQPQDLGDHALPCSASSPVSRSRPKAAAAIARKGA